MRRITITLVCLLLSSTAFALSVDDAVGTAPLKQTYTERNHRPSYSSRERVRPVYRRPKHETRQSQQVGKLRLASASALVIDQTNGAMLYGKNIGARQPIASITKLMTAMVVLDGHQALDEKISVTEDDVDHIKFSTSRLTVGSVLTRFEMLQLALMSSENRAASALGRSYPGGIEAFVEAMNNKAKAIGMDDSTFADASGLDQRNMSTASDLARMVGAAYGYDVIRQVSTTASYIVETDNYRPTQYRNSNALISNKDWDIGLSKTGFIREAGHCLVMQAQISTRNLIIILLDGQGKMTRVGDANRIKKWLENTQFKSNQIS
ncbi:MAG: D-alanyl-D-alanine endopeptidase [Gammaproteobacteria bacterium]|nr:D-alanyl-D-alanine endopeptidase [Gammaproteobacteria bacterium]